MAFIKEESEDVKIEETFRVKQKDLQEQTDLMVLKEETHQWNEIEEKHQDITTDKKPTLTKKTSSCGRPRKSKSSCNLSCKQSRKSFSQKPNLDVHTRKKPYTCKQCGKSFYNTGNLIVHMRIHTGERPYTCQQCGKSFYTTGNLAVHMRIHTGERLYSCPQCGKSCKQNGNLEAHMRTHTGERSFICTQCGKGFSQKQNLTIHMRIHTGEKPPSRHTTDLQR
uniref:Uncharacterized protein LOC100137105 n=1 Tax=Danio rerio TaxID=7955 RepID=A9JRS0_DANRE|nr:uncharacterized protein LOC100137105 [Danio rerio]AAI55769.1 Zgc:174710 protein [Danio rerio]|eukprot:NP_001108174.1 uncharacterized protein LOC100137105 [Danio rerio]